MKKILSIVLIATFLTACSQDASLNHDSEDGDNVEVNLVLSVPVNTGTRAEIPEESKINTVDILVFKRATATDSADDAIYQYARYAWNKSGNEYRATLKYGEHLDIYFAINIDNSILSSLSAGTDTYATAHEKLLLTASPSGISCNNLPMWGSIFNTTVAESSGVLNFGTVKLLRAVASADIVIKDNTFTFSEAIVVYGTNKAYLAHRKSDLDASNGHKVTAVYTPSGTTYTTSWAMTPSQNPDGFYAVENKCYMYGNDADGTNDLHYTKLIVKGIYNASQGNTRETFYPLAFRNDDNEKVKVARNRKFIIIVNEVNGDGYNTLEEAKNAEDVNMDYDVFLWDQYEDTDVIIDGTCYISFSNGKSMILADKQGATAQSAFTTNALDWDAATHTPTDLLLSFHSDFSDPGTASIENERFRVKVLKDPATGRTYFLAETRIAYAAGTAAHKAAVYVRFGRVSFSVTVEQVENYWLPGDDIDTDLS